MCLRQKPQWSSSALMEDATAAEGGAAVSCHQWDITTLILVALPPAAVPPSPSSSTFLTPIAGNPFNLGSGDCAMIITHC